MRNTDLFEDYLNGKISAEDKAVFEQRLRNEEMFAKAFSEHKILMDLLNEHAERNKLKTSLEEIHRAEFGNSRIISINKDDTFARRYGRTVMVAASTALIAVLSTVAILSTGGYMLKKQSAEITDLKRDVIELKASSEAIVEGLTAPRKIAYAPANLEGTAFALNNNGYIITSFHMINGADSVFIENKSFQRTLARVVVTDPRLDLAILKIDNAGLTKSWQLPFVFAPKSSDIGEKVFTLGYPKKDMVYGEGSLSSLSGFPFDTTMYQVSIPVNPGNSGGPLLDEQGNIIGVIRGKITSAEGTGFAIKSREILKAISALSADSIQVPSRKSSLKGVKRTEQIKKIDPYVFNVLVYKKD
jgi:serine protease Do